MESQDIQNKAQMIWSIADKLTGAYKPHEYGLVILPFTVLRRLDCALEGTRAAVMEAYEKGRAQGFTGAPLDIMLKDASGLSYYSLNPRGLRSVLDDPMNVKGALVSFINNFSPEVRDLLAEFDVMNQIERLSSASSSSRGLLYQVVDEMTQQRNDLSPERISDIDMGYIFEEIIRTFSESYNEDAGQHYTPRDAIDLMVELLVRPEDREPGKARVRRMLDPACGTGGMLSESRRHMARHCPDVTLHCYGQEYNQETYAICRANSLIKGGGAEDSLDVIEKGDTLSDFKFAGMRFNYVISNPPFGREWKVEADEVEAEARSPGGRFSHGLPSKSDSQLLFLCTAEAAMEGPGNGGGRVAIIHNGSALFAGDAGSGPSSIRGHLLESDVLDAIVALPENIFYNTGIGTYIWILDNMKPPERRGKVQLIDARAMHTPRRKNVGNKRVDIDEAARESVAAAYRACADGEFGDGSRSCRSVVLPASEFAYAKVPVRVPELDAEGNVVRSRKGEPVWDKSKSTTEEVPLRGLELRPGRDPLDTEEARAMVEAHLDSEVRPYLPGAEADWSKAKVGYEIPFTRYFYVSERPRPSAEVRAEIDGLAARISELMGRLRPWPLSTALRSRTPA